MMTREQWYEKFPRLRKWGLTDGEFWVNECTNEAGSLLPFIPEDRPFFAAEIGRKLEVFPFRYSWMIRL